MLGVFDDKYSFCSTASNMFDQIILIYNYFCVRAAMNVYFDCVWLSNFKIMPKTSIQRETVSRRSVMRSEQLKSNV